MPLALRALLLILLALVPAGVIQVVMEREARELRTEQLAEQALRLARLVSQQLIRNVEGAQQVLAAITAHEAVRELRPSAECNEFLRRLVLAYPRYRTATVFTPDGDPLCSALGERSQANIRDRPHFRAVMRDRAFNIGEYAIGRTTGEASLHLAAPLLGPDGEVQAVAALALSIDWIVADLRSLELPPGANATIADRNGIILARTVEAERLVGTPISAQAMTLLNRSGPSVLDSVTLDGTRRINAILPVETEPRGMMVALGLDPAAALAEASTRERRSVLMIMGSLVAALLLGVLGFGVLIQRPVGRMLDAAARWSRQDWSARLGRVGGGREFTRLAAALDGMAGEVQRREAERAASEDRLRALLDVSPQVVFSANAQGHVTWLNRWWWNYTGTAPEAAPNEAWKRALHPDDDPARIAAWADAMRRLADGQEGEYLTELRLRRSLDGQFRWHVCRAAALRDTDGEVTGWTGVALDVHDLRTAHGARRGGAGGRTPARDL